MSKEDFIVGSSKVEDFWKFINERHKIYLKRREGLPRPWTEDPIFLDWKFTNVFRELDRGTIAIRQVLKELYKEHKEYSMRMQSCKGYDEQDEEGRRRTVKELEKRYIRNQFITCILYRMFNWHGNAKFGPIDNPTAWYKYLNNKLDNGQRIIGDSCPNYYKRECTLESYIEVCREIVSDADDLIFNIKDYNTLEYAWGLLLEYKCVCQLVAYEFACDLRYTDILLNATDTCTWCNIGPGAESGLKRMGLEPTLECVQELYKTSLQELPQCYGDHWLYDHFDFYPKCDPKDEDPKIVSGKNKKYPYWELREIEHCLCEFDKYERIRLGQGRPRAKYNGRPLETSHGLIVS